MTSVVARLRYAAHIAFFLSLMLPSPGGAAEKIKIVISGSSTIAPLVSEIVERFEKQNPDYQVDVQSGGSSRGVNDVRRGLTNIGMVSREMKPDEQDLNALTIANDGLVMIVHARNKLATLSDDAIRKIYTRQIVNWETLGGGLNGPITLVHKAEGRSTVELFLEYTKLKPADVRPDVVIGENEEAIRLVASTPGAIGYVSYGTAAYHAGNGTPIKLISLGTVPASEESIANGTYQSRRPLNIVSQPGRSAEIEKFWKFSASKGVEDLVRGNFFTPPAR